LLRTLCCCRQVGIIQAFISGSKDVVEFSHIMIQMKFHSEGKGDALEADFIDWHMTRLMLLGPDGDCVFYLDARDEAYNDVSCCGAAVLRCCGAAWRCGGAAAWLVCAALPACKLGFEVEINKTL